MAHFLQGLEEISPILPWVVRAILVTAAVIFAWVLFSLPAFWLCRAVGPFIRRGADSLFAASQRWLIMALSYFKKCAVPVEGFIEAHAQVFSFADENTQVIGGIAHLRERVQSIPDRVETLQTSILDAERRFSAVGDSIASIELPEGIDAPSAQQFAKIQAADNHALAKLIVAIIFSPAMMAINTGMLNEFFESLWPGLERFGISIATFLAFLFTFAEFGFGAIMVFQNRAVQYLMGLGVAALAIIEFSCYARLGQGFGWSPMEAFYAQGQAPEWTTLWFGVFGLAIVLLLAVAGHTLVSAITELQSNHVVKQWKKYVAARMANASALRERLVDAERAKSALKKSLDDVASIFSGSMDIAESGIAVISNAKSDFMAEIDKAARIRLDDQRKLGRGAMLRVYFQSIFFVFSSLLALALSALIFGLVSPPEILAFAGPNYSWILACGEAFVLVIGGAATSRENATLPSAAGAAPSDRRHDKTGILVGGVIFAAIVLSNAFVMLRPFSWGGAMMWTALIALDAALFWLGTRLGVLVAAIWATVSAIAIAGLAILVGGFGALLRTGWALLSLILILLILLAFPFGVIVLRDPSGAKILPREAAA